MPSHTLMMAPIKNKQQKQEVSVGLDGGEIGTFVHVGGNVNRGKQDEVSSENKK